MSIFNLVPSLAHSAEPPKAVAIGKVSTYHAIVVDDNSLTYFPGFSPDPVLSGIAVGETIQGMQSSGIMACTKHYILNEQEHFRQSGP